MKMALNFSKTFFSLVLPTAVLLLSAAVLSVPLNEPKVALAMGQESKSSVSAAGDPATCGYDLVFVLDSSESITRENFGLMKNFVSNFVQSLMVKFDAAANQTGIQVALVPFNTNAFVDFRLSDTKSFDSVKTALDNLIYTPGLTNPESALQLVYSDVLTEANGDRPAYPNLVILITDGAYTPGAPSPKNSSALIRTDKNTPIVALGVAGLNGPDSGVFYHQLIDITGTADLVFNITSFAGLYTELPTIAKNIKCHSV